MQLVGIRYTPKYFLLNAGITLNTNWSSKQQMIYCDNMAIPRPIRQYSDCWSLNGGVSVVKHTMGQTGTKTGYISI